MSAHQVTFIDDRRHCEASPRYQVQCQTCGWRSVRLSTWHDANIAATAHVVARGRDPQETPAEPITPNGYGPDATPAEALTHLGLLTIAEREHVLRTIAQTHPALVLAAVKAEERVWHGRVE